MQLASDVVVRTLRKARICFNMAVAGVCGGFLNAFNAPVTEITHKCVIVLPGRLQNIILLTG